jgi:hypothetical protein
MDNYLLMSNDDLLDLYTQLVVDVDNHPLNTPSQHHDAIILQSDRNQVRDILLQRMSN